jgi:hypothetical protein
MTDTLDLPYYNSTNYPLAVKNQLEKIPYSKDEIESKALHYHQFVVKEFFTKNPHLRGLLICHGMGQGKTRLAVAIADHYRRFDRKRNVIVLLPKSLESNFGNTVKSYSGKDDAYVKENYKFVSLNASNMFKQISNIDRTKEEIDFEKRLGNFMDDVTRENSLNGSVLFIDEAHNLFNAITNGAKNATALYDLIMASNVKLVFLTGTPITNDPFELVPCFNMLRGYINTDVNIKGGGVFGGDGGDSEDDGDSGNDGNDGNDDNGNDRDTEDTVTADIDTDKSQKYKRSEKPDRSNRPDRPKNQSHKKPTSNRFQKGNQKKKTITNTTTLFSESVEEFEDFFVDRVNKTIKNKDKFTNRIYGLSSYYGDIYFPTTTNKPGFPKKLETVIEKVPMSQSQFSRYIIARHSEQEETKKGFKGSDSRFSASKGGSSTYRVKSRQISNYCIPEYALGPVRGNKAREKFIDKITNDDILNTDEYSPKMGKIFSNIQKHADTLGMIYSQFVSGEGLAIFAKVLEANGYVNFMDKSASGFDEVDTNNRAKKYAILSGDIDPDERSDLIRSFNDPSNADGSIIHLLLLSGAVAEGIDLKRIRHVHVMEPFWNFARINQVETRAIRYMSHFDLPLEKQNVQVYIYLSDYPLGYPKSKIKELTTDVELYNKSIDNMKIITTFMYALAESSIDCMLHYPKLDEVVRKHIKCKLCSPNNQILFHPLLTRDMELPNNCMDYTEKKVSVHEIVWEPTGEKFYYNYDNSGEIKLFQFNNKLNGYTHMQRTHKLYGKIMQMIIDKESE